MRRRRHGHAAHALFASDRGKLPAAVAIVAEARVQRQLDQLVELTGLLLADVAAIAANAPAAHLPAVRVGLVGGAETVRAEEPGCLLLLQAVEGSKSDRRRDLLVVGLDLH